VNNPPAGDLPTDREPPTLPPLCVDLDGTLLKTDTLVEALLAVLGREPWQVIPLLFSLCKGRQILKEKAARHARIDPNCLPYRADFIDFLRLEKAKGRELILATAAHEQVATEIARHVGLFSRVIASDARSNLKGPHKIEAIRAAIGGQPFDYAGNDAADLAIWRHAANAIVVDASASLIERVRKVTHVSVVFPRDSNFTRTLLRAIRVHQWVKNLLLFVPLVMAHRIGDLRSVALTFLGFLSFSLCASSVYVLNDLLDLRSDRLHATKRRRAFASGDLDLRLGLVLIPLLLLASFALASFLPLAFSAILLLYGLVTLCYSLYAKRIIMLDVMILASLYTIRLFAGGVVTDVVISHWLLAFSMFAFFSLAMIKRVSELQNLIKSNLLQTQGRGYHVGDREQLAALGAASGNCSVLVLALYVHSETGVYLYAHPDRLWLLCPLVFYWISRMWLLAHRGVVHEDPLVFAIKDPVSYLLGALIALVLWAAV
jgi:4-hydroxybenzoate polyprenyltransferase